MLLFPNAAGHGQEWKGEQPIPEQLCRLHRWRRLPVKIDPVAGKRAAFTAAYND